MPSENDNIQWVVNCEAVTSYVIGWESPAEELSSTLIVAFNADVGPTEEESLCVYA